MLGILKKVLLGSQEQSPVIGEFIDFIESLESEASSDDSLGGEGNPNLFLINVDTKG
jgi:hypothetical protein